MGKCLLADDDVKGLVFKRHVEGIAVDKVDLVIELRQTDGALVSGLRYVDTGYAAAARIGQVSAGPPIPLQTSRTCVPSEMPALSASLSLASRPPK